MRDRDRLWQAGEAAAAEAYRRRGYRVLARNWRCRLGELDLVLARGDQLVVCEVKARRSGPSAPFDAVHADKQRRLRRLAEAFLEEHRLDPPSVRFDVASVRAGERGLDVHLFEDAF